MTPAQITRRLNSISRMVNKLDAELKERFGPQAFIFCETEGGLCAMDGDAEGKFDGASDRQEHIIASQDGCIQLGVGAW